MVAAAVGKRIQIPCTLNRASLGHAKYVFVIIENSLNNPRKIAWVPREDITINSQPLKGIELKAKLEVDIVERSDTDIIITFLNDGIQEILKIEKELLD